MDSLDLRLEQLVQQGRINLKQAFTLSKELPSCSSDFRTGIVQKLEDREITGDQALELIRQKRQTNDQAFDEFKDKLKSFGREMGREIEGLVADFDKDQFKENLRGLFDDLSRSFSQSRGADSRTVNGDYNERDYHIHDQLVVKGKGTFTNLDVHGSLTVEGDGEIKKLRGNGTVHIKGDLICKSLDFEGELFVQGNIQCGTAVNNGRLHCRGDYTGADLDNRGTLNNQGDIQLMKLINSGSLSADRSIRSDRVDSTGLLNCLGIMRASLVTLQEGRIFYLEADQVHLGSGCRVEDLAYRVEYTKDEGAKVRREKKID